MLTLSRQKSSENGVMLQVFEGDGVRVTVSYHPPADIVGFILSFDFDGAFHHCLEWNPPHDFNYGKIHKRSPDLIEQSKPDRPFARDRVALVVAPEYQLLFEAIQKRLDEYANHVG